jgi:hypothetical protein
MRVLPILMDTISPSGFCTPPCRFVWKCNNSRIVGNTGSAGLNRHVVGMQESYRKGEQRLHYATRAPRAATRRDETLGVLHQQPNVRQVEPA